MHFLERWIRDQMLLGWILFSIWLACGGWRVLVAG